MRNLLLTIIAKLSKPQPAKEERPVIPNRPVHWVDAGDRRAPDQLPPDMEERFVVHHFRRTEPSDYWKIE